MELFEKQFSATWCFIPEKNSGVIVTIPDESLTIRQILDRYSKGLPTGLRDSLQHYGSDDGFDSFDDALPNDVDLSDLDDNKQRYNEYKNSYDDFLLSKKKSKQAPASERETSEGSVADVAK